MDQFALSIERKRVVWLHKRRHASVDCVSIIGKLDSHNERIVLLMQSDEFEVRLLLL